LTTFLRIHFKIAIAIFPIFHDDLLFIPLFAVRSRCSTQKESPSPHNAGTGGCSAHWKFREYTYVINALVLAQKLRTPVGLISFDGEKSPASKIGGQMKSHPMNRIEVVDKPGEPG
jgi:hypothetical protein